MPGPRERLASVRLALEKLAEYSYSESSEITSFVESVVPTYHSPDSDLETGKDVYEILMKEASATVGQQQLA